MPLPRRGDRHRLSAGGRHRLCRSAAGRARPPHPASCQCAISPGLAARPPPRTSITPRRIALGVPEGGRDYSFGDAFPHEAMFDQLNGVDFKKGCFVGQEVVSRMEHRGTARKRIVGVEGEAPLPASGTRSSRRHADRHAWLGQPAARGLALLRLDRAEEAKAAGTPLTCGRGDDHVRIPALARFKFPWPCRHMSKAEADALSLGGHGPALYRLSRRGVGRSRARRSRALFEKLVLEGFQAGLSWITILRKREAFRARLRQFRRRKNVPLLGRGKVASLMKTKASSAIA